MKINPDYSSDKNNPFLSLAISPYAMDVIASSAVIEAFTAAEWPRICAIYLEGILTGNATFESEPPIWNDWDRSHLPFGRLAAWSAGNLVGWAALSPVSQRTCYAGVAEVSVYVSASARSQGIGHTLMQQLIAVSEQHGIWTLQGGIFPENVSSLRMCTSSGFRQVGRRKHIAKLNGLWRDTVLVERRSSCVGVS